MVMVVGLWWRAINVMIQLIIHTQECEAIGNLIIPKKNEKLKLEDLNQIEKKTIDSKVRIKQNVAALI